MIKDAHKLQVELLWYITVDNSSFKDLCVKERIILVVPCWGGGGE